MENIVVFEPSGKKICSSGTETVLELIRRSGVGIKAVCGGTGMCGKCKVKIIPETSASELTDSEKKLLSKKEISEGIRLACEVHLISDATVDIPLSSCISEQIVLSEGKENDFIINPSVNKYEVILPKATLEDYRDDFTRLCDTLKENFSDIDSDPEIDYDVLKSLSCAIRKGKWSVTVFIRENKFITGILPGLNRRFIGMAVDIGTTTLAAYLCDMETGETLQTASMMNPQVRFGDDVLARTSYCMMNDDGLETLHNLLIDGINSLCKKMAEKEGISTAEIAEAVFAGNTVMSHIALNIPPDTIGKSPFTASTARSVDVAASRIGLNIMSGAGLHVLPSEAGFVGADNVAVLIAEEPYKSKEIRLIIDIGTNSEIALGNSDKLLVTSCATGPALEGAQISCGMRAAEGAVEKIKINSDTFESELKIIGNRKVPAGICGSGIIDAVAEMATAGIIDKSGRFRNIADSEFIRKDDKGKPEFVIYKAKNDSETDVTIKARDVRAVQLAKAALHAAVKILMRELEISEFDSVTLAGAFGSYIDKNSALLLGMFPVCDPEKIYVSGNSAGVGARYALLSKEKRREADQIAGKTIFVETAADFEFQKIYAECMAFPL